MVPKTRVSPDGDYAEEMLRDIHRAVRGYNGEVGLVGDMEIQRRAVEALETRMNDLEAAMERKPAVAEETKLQKYKTLAIWGSLGLAALSVAADVIPYFRGD